MGAEEGKPGENGGEGAQGAPDLKAQNTRLNAENAQLKKDSAALQAQIDEINGKLEKALTEEDVNAAVQKVKDDSAAASSAIQEKADRRVKRLTVENALIAGGCSDTVSTIAHLDLDGIEVAKDGHVSGLDVAKLKEKLPHLFGTAPVVSSAAPSGGSPKKMTKEEIMAIKDGAKRRAAIAEHEDLFE